MHSTALEDLNDSLPPASTYLVLPEATACVLADDLAPERLRWKVFRHFTYLPAAAQGGEHRVRKKLAYALVPVLLKDEELVHPVAVRSDANRLISESEARVLTIDDGDKGMETFCVPVAVERIAVLTVRVEILIPDVRQVVLIELKHPLDR